MTLGGHQALLVRKTLSSGSRPHFLLLSIYFLPAFSVAGVLCTRRKERGERKIGRKEREKVIAPKFPRQDSGIIVSNISQTKLCVCVCMYVCLCVSVL